MSASREALLSQGLSAVVRESWPVESAASFTCLTDKLAAIGTRNGGILLIDLQSGTPLKLLTGHIGSAFAVDVSPDGTFLASTGEDCTIRIWGIDDGDLDLELSRARPAGRPAPGNNVDRRQGTEQADQHHEIYLARSGMGLFATGISPVDSRLLHYA